ncbi:MAG: hypothetical protein CFE47_29085 [Pseudomonas sp. PGPPP1]|uniref:hypothetical protein n=1 Tax=Pseudomonas sp. PGPPP1 TaxID=2015553 RepID=UPI000BC90F91|nr:hypothetical protein [Pseudomonas sp. PGPPP1]OYU03993.1 MAG: hypothetical protein CFE47_29085 [Pseudomonas sp. PGPPP1]
MKAVDLTPAEVKTLEQRRSALGAIDCSIEQKNKLISGIRDYRGSEYGMTQYGSYQVLSVHGSGTLPAELEGTFTDARHITQTIDNLIAEGKLIELK